MVQQHPFIGTWRKPDGFSMVIERQNDKIFVYIDGSKPLNFAEVEDREKVINAIALLSQNIEMVLMIKILFFKDTSRRQGMTAALRSLIVAIIFLVPILLHLNNDNYYDKMVVAIMIANTTATFHQE
jgi:hypothetical protein